MSARVKATEPKLGRPARSGEAAEVLSLRVSAAEREAWTDAAGEMPLGQWIRGACAAALTRGGKVAAVVDRRPQAARLRKVLDLVGEALADIEGAGGKARGP